MQKLAWTASCFSFIINIHHMTLPYVEHTNTPMNFWMQIYSNLSIVVIADFKLLYWETDSEMPFFPGKSFPSFS